MITTKRLMNGRHQIYNDGMPIGKAWKWPNGSGFGISIDGMFWRNGSPANSGATATSAKRLKDVPAFVQEAIEKFVAISKK